MKAMQVKLTNAEPIIKSTTFACPSCAKEIGRHRVSSWRYSGFSYAMFLVGGIVGVVGFWTLEGMIAAAPTMFCMALAMGAPRVRSIDCPSCGISVEKGKPTQAGPSSRARTASPSTSS